MWNTEGYPAMRMSPDPDTAMSHCLLLNIAATASMGVFVHLLKLCFLQLCFACYAQAHV